MITHEILVIQPESQYNNVLSQIEHAPIFADMSISRPKSRLEWGIPFMFGWMHL